MLATSAIICFLLCFEMPATRFFASTRKVGVKAFQPTLSRSFRCRRPPTRFFQPQRTYSVSRVHAEHQRGQSLGTTSSAGLSVQLDTDDEYKLLKGLNENQIEAVTLPRHSISRVIAGPGSGKTRVLTTRIAWLLITGRRDNILAVTFTRKAAGEMQRRLMQMVDPGRRATVGTFHSVCAKILRYNGNLLASLPSVQADMKNSTNTTLLNEGFAILDQVDTERRVKEIINEKNINLKTDYRTEVKFRNVMSAMSFTKKKMFDDENPFAVAKDESLPPALDVVQKIYYAYRDRLLSSNCLDFDDLMFLARELLRVHPNVLERLQSYWTHVLVDEFQDTSRTQMDIVKLLTQTSLLVVGDADQSIYSWRGAHAGSLADFEEEFNMKCQGDAVRTVYLMENYR